MKIRIASIVAIILFSVTGSGCMMLGGGSSTTETNGGNTPTGPTPGEWNVGPTVRSNPDVGDRRWKPIFFAYDQSTIGAAERPKLKAIYEYLRENNQFDLLVEGHCDDRGSEEYNRTLGERRAITVRDYLVKLGLPKSRIRTLSFGEERPKASGTTEAAYRQNRRAELVVIASSKGTASK